MAPEQYRAMQTRTMSNSTSHKMSFPADTTWLAKVRQMVLEAAGAHFSPTQANLIALAVDEAVANIMEHAYDFEREATHNDIELELEASPTALRIVIRDHGIGFDPREAPDVDVRDHVKKGRKGGLGIFLMRRIMDEITYAFKHGVHNELQMVKYVDGKSSKAKS